jgi:FMN phosphatase YigB (HAD superfamily)
MTFKRLVVFDLDETIIDSKHRTPNRPDGTLDLDRYFAMKNRESIFRDTLLPLADTFKRMCRQDNYIVICTARAMNQDDRDFLKHFELDAHLVLCRPEDGSENHIKDPVLKARKIQRLRNLKQFRGKPVVMFDDSQPVIRRMREIGVACLNAVKVNQRLCGL